jgi:hypothetical protein
MKMLFIGKFYDVPEGRRAAAATQEQGAILRDDSGD